jgi:hypothetical protein
MAVGERSSVHQQRMIGLDADPFQRDRTSRLIDRSAMKDARSVGLLADNH